MNLEGYKEIEVKPNKLCGIFIHIIAFIVAIIYAIVIIIFNIKSSDGFHNINITKSIIYILEFFTIVISHELIHKYTFKFYGKLDVSYMKINFKFFIKKLSVTLEDFTTVGVLRVALIMPTFILFIVITIINLTSRDIVQSIFIALVISGGASDIPLFFQLKGFDEEDIVKDNENETGCKVYIK